MSDESTAAPAAAPTTSAPATSTPASAPAAAPVVDDTNPVWLSERLRREGAAALKAAGIKVGKGDDPKAIAAEAKAKNESRKEKLRAEKTRADAAEAKLADLENVRVVQDSALKVYAATELDALPEKQREFVKKAAGDDVAEILKAVALFKSTGALNAPMEAASAAPAAAAAPAAPAGIAAPASTAAVQSAPAPGQAGATDLDAQYRNLKDTNPYYAAEFLLNHPEIAMSKLRGGS